MNISKSIMKFSKFKMNFWNFRIKPFAFSSYARQGPKSYFSTIVPTTNATKLHDDQTLIRRSANYPPPTWNFDHIQSLPTQFVGERYRNEATQLKDKISYILDEKKETIEQLELIDDLQRLGLSHHFESQSKQILSAIYKKCCGDFIMTPNKNNLYATALYFRLLRQHGFNVSQDIFSCFITEDGKIKYDIFKDVKGMLYLYEASYLLVEGENTLELLMNYTTKHLKKNVEDGKLDEDVSVLVKHALEIPLQWRMPRLEARWFIDIYERREDMNHIVLHLAKLDFNIVQAQHLQDLKDVSRWWTGTRLGENLPFARDRIVENFFWTVGLMSNPEYSYFRKTMTKVNALITTIDDIYDVYATLDELEVFTDAVQRWDTKAIEQLPSCMKLCFMALYNNINDMAYDATLKQTGAHNIAHYLIKAWGALCKTYLQEAKWYSNGYTPRLEEYLNNAWISISGPVILVHVYFLLLLTFPFPFPLMEEKAIASAWLDNYHDIICYSSIILRLANDLGTSLKEIERGDVPKSDTVLHK